MSAEQSSISLDAPAAAPANGRAALVVLLAFAVFSAADALVKIMAGHLPPPQVTFLVTAVALVILVAHAAMRGRLARLVPRQPGLAIFRAALLAGDTVLIHYAFSMLPLAEAYLIAFLTPILVAVLGFLLIGERLTKLATLGVLVGFAGVAVALKPGVAPLNFGHAAALGSAVFFALSLILLRKTKSGETDEALVASALVVLIPIALALAVTTEGLSPLQGNDIWLALAGGVLMLAGHGLLVRAFRIGEASVVAPFQYSQIIWGCLLGVFLFATPVELHTLAGAAIVIASGFLVLK